MVRPIPIELTVPVTLDGTATVKLAGQEVTDALHAVQVEIRHGYVNQVHLELAAAEVNFTGDADVTIPDSTRRILRALGWTPPGDDTALDVPAARRALTSRADDLGVELGDVSAIVDAVLDAATGR